MKKLKQDLDKFFIVYIQVNCGAEFLCYISSLVFTRKYQLRGYILGVLTHTTALDQLWGGDGTLTVWF